MSLALGDQYAGVFANDDDWRGEIVAAGEAASGDYVWPFPLHPRYRRLIDSAFADMKNSSLRRLGGARVRDVLPRGVRGRRGRGRTSTWPARGCLTWSRGDYLSQIGGTGWGVVSHA